MLKSLALISVLSSVVSAVSQHSNVALYWGQNSEGDQTTLATTCQNEDADIIILSFVYEFGSNYGTNVNFANMCGDTYSSGLLHCSQIGEDIETCQSLGKTILLSLGGASGAYGFSSDSDAESYAATLWNTFGAGSDSSVDRPFDDAVVDGFDFDIENNVNTGYAALVTKLRTYFDEDTSKNYFISASPQCPYPDASVGNLLENAKVDFAFIQFYNNYCSTIGSYFNWDTWNTYAETVSPNPDIKLFVGLPAGTGAAGSGYATLDEIKTTFEDYILNIEDTYFGGFALWDASWSSFNTVNDDTFGNNLKSLLTNAYGDSTATSTTKNEKTTESTSSTSTTSTTSTTPTEELRTITTTSSTSSTSSTSTVVLPTNTNTIDTSSEETTTFLNEEYTSMVGGARNIDVTTTLTTSTTSSTSSSTSTTSTFTNTDCSSLTGLSKAQCYNKNFADGLYLGSTTCSEGDNACGSDGSFAICNFGSWVSIQCAPGTTCYAYNTGDDVDIGCDYTSQKSSYQKRDGLASLFKRHFHNLHRA
ncbi:hypothetical protein C6P40_005332 [Pichia californica]|uniref:chitinase n=1 Tax=Pichia californica TaxID=460514 RepID=A0A9P6WLT2_9ASCO|nr:hypothetical protein C6P40_005332 [[Candida] californica]